jgi:hypothetical protein
LAVCSVGRGKKANLDKSDTLKRGASPQLAQFAHLKRMALSDLPVPKKGALRRIGNLKKTIIVGDIVFVREVSQKQR